MNTLIYNRYFQTTAVVLLALLMILAMSDPSFAQLADDAQRGVDAAGGGQGQSVPLGEIIKDVVNFLLFAIGILSVIMIIIGAIRYVLSGGDANATKGARDTILYAIVGLVIAFVAFGIVNFVTGLFSTP